MRDLDHPVKLHQGTLLELIAPKEFGVVAKIPQKPAQLPKRLLRAIDPAGNEAAGKLLGFEHRELDGVEGLLLMPAVLGPLDADKIDAVRHFGGLGGLVQAREATFHAAPSCRPR